MSYLNGCFRWLETIGFKPGPAAILVGLIAWMSHIQCTQISDLNRNVSELQRNDRRLSSHTHDMFTELRLYIQVQSEKGGRTPANLDGINKELDEFEKFMDEIAHHSQSGEEVELASASTEERSTISPADHGSPEHPDTRTQKPNTYTIVISESEMAIGIGVLTVIVLAIIWISGKKGRATRDESSATLANLSLVIQVSDCQYDDLEAINKIIENRKARSRVEKVG